MSKLNPRRFTIRHPYQSLGTTEGPGADFSIVRVDNRHSAFNLALILSLSIYSIYWFHIFRILQSTFYIPLGLTLPKFLLHFYVDLMEFGKEMERTKQGV